MHVYKITIRNVLRVYAP